MRLLSTSQRGASDSFTELSVLSNPDDAHNVSCLGLCDRDIYPKSYTLNMRWVILTISCQYLYKDMINNKY